MRKFRAVAAGALAATIVGAGATVGGAAAAPATGVGTAKTSTSVLQVQLGGGSLLDLRVVGEDSQSTIDKKTGPTSAFTRIVPLTVASKAVSALNTSLPAIEARAPGGSSSVPPVSVPLSTPASTGTLTLASLTATVDQAGAKSALSSALENLSLAGGLVGGTKVSSTLGTDALSTAAAGTRGLKADNITVLDLGALLDGLGLELTDLPLDVVSALLGQLKLPVPGVDPTTTLNQAVTTLQSAIAQVSAEVTKVTGGGTIDTGTIGGVVGGVNDVLGQVTTGSLLQGQRRPQAITDNLPIPTDLAGLQNTLSLLNTNLVDVLGNALGVLDAAPLLQLKGIDVGLATKAADTVQNSSAAVNAVIGDVVIGGLTLDGIDLGATLTQITNTANALTAQLSSTLGVIDPGLTSLVNVKLFEQTKDVKSANGYSTATAGVSALTATITPPADLGAIVSKVQGLTGVGDLLGSLGVRLPAQLPVLSDLMGQLESVLGVNVQALAQGATVRVANISSTSEFTPAPVPPSGAPATPTGGELPRTGSDNAVFAVFGVLFLALAAAIVRWLRRPVNAL